VLTISISKNDELFGMKNIDENIGNFLTGQ